MLSHLPRLAFLASRHGPRIPRVLHRYLPQIDLLSALSTKGVAGAQVELGLEEEQLMEMLESGAENGLGSLEEFKTLAASIVTDELELKRESMPFSKYLNELGLLHAWVTSKDDLVEFAEQDLSEAYDVDSTLVKWRSGFAPMDEVLGGCYQGIFTLIARPGDGKTSMFLTIMEEIRKSNSASSIWFFETEIPMKMMMYRMKPILQRTEFLSTDRMICGQTPVDDILERMEEDPDPDRVIIYDSPDVLAAGMDNERRFALEEIYRKLVTIKGRCKLVLTASQPRRNDRHLSITSVAEAWAKAWYSDVVIGMTRRVGTGGSMRPVSLNVAKNRFGIPDQEISFDYDYAELRWFAAQLQQDPWADDLEDW